jgi:hypothetical protein
LRVEWTMKVPTQDPDGRYRFKKALWKVVVDALLGLALGLVFVGMAVGVAYGVLPGASEAGAVNRAIAALLSGFFGLFLLAGGAGSIGRLFNRTLLEVGHDGIATSEMGFLPWNDVEELRREQWTAPGNRVGRVQRYVTRYRLGIVPREGAQLHPSRSAAVARALAGAFYRVLSFIPLLPKMGHQGLSPYGVEMYELNATLDDVVPVVAQFHEVR